MKPTDTGLTIHIEEKALKFIRSRRLKEPLIMVGMGSRSGDEGCDGGCGCGGGCGDGDNKSSTPYLNVVMVDGGKPGNGFVKVETQAGIPVYLAKPVHDCAKRNENSLFITVKGLVIKRLSLEGLDMTMSPEHSSGDKSSCH